MLIYYWKNREEKTFTNKFTCRLFGNTTLQNASSEADLQSLYYMGSQSFLLFNFVIINS